MTEKQSIYCPNCGNSAERHQDSASKIIRTSCYYCDYLLVQCSETGRVIEAYAPGVNSLMSRIEMPLIARKQH